jgi:hypothetical protein
MAIEQKYTDLINADIDGEIRDADKAELQAFLAGSEEGQEMHARLEQLAQSLDALDELDPPPHLRHVIMSSIPAAKPKAATRGWLDTLTTMPALRYAATFVAGALLTMSIVGSKEISRSAFDDMSGLVGTLADPAALGPADDSVEINTREVAGTVSLRSSGTMLVLDFDLVAGKRINVIADYTDKTIWFNGFAQLESSGTSMSAEAGHIELVMEGKRRYAVFLHNEGGRDTEIALKFMDGDEVVYTSTLSFAGSGD